MRLAKFTVKRRGKECDEHGPGVHDVTYEDTIHRQPGSVEPCAGENGTYLRNIFYGDTQRILETLEEAAAEINDALNSNGVKIIVEDNFASRKMVSCKHCGINFSAANAERYCSTRCQEA